LLEPEFAIACYNSHVIPDIIQQIICILSLTQAVHVFKTYVFKGYLYVGEYTTAHSTRTTGI